MSNINFYSEYININFDEILLENNNNLLTSEEFYLTYKKEYFDQTSNNFEKFKIVNDELQQLTNLNVPFKTNDESSSTTKYKYVYTDFTRYEYLKQEVKNLIISQNKLLDNFYHYITLLNTHPEKFKVKNEEVQQKRSFLSKLLTSKKTQKTN